MEKKYPNYWKNDTDEGGKNLYEDRFLDEQISRFNLNNLKYEYIKITNLKAGRKLAEKTHNWEKCEERIESLYRYVKLNSINPS